MIESAAGNICDTRRGIANGWGTDADYRNGDPISTIQ